MENLPPEIFWHIQKFLRHPVAEIFMMQKAYNHYLSSKDDLYINIGGEEFQINDMIPFYDVWRVYKRRPNRVRIVDTKFVGHKVISRIVKIELE